MMIDRMSHHMVMGLVFTIDEYTKTSNSHSVMMFQYNEQKNVTTSVLTDWLVFDCLILT